MNQKMVFFDIDGTLLSEVTGCIPTNTIKAIHKLQENGHLAFINTGRAYSFLDKEILEIGFDGLLCGCGTFISYHNEEMIHHKLSESMCRHIVELLREYKLDAILEGKEKSYGEKYDKMNTQMFRDFTADFKHPYDTWDAKELSFDKFFMYSEKADAIEQFQKELIEEFVFIDREHGFYEVVPKSYSKATGMKEMAGHLNVDLEDTIAIGDSSNDLMMLEAAGISIAMGNALEHVKEKVDFVTTDVDKNGIENALKHFGLI